MRYFVARTAIRTSHVFTLTCFRFLPRNHPARIFAEGSAKRNVSAILSASRAPIAMLCVLVAAIG